MNDLARWPYNPSSNIVDPRPNWRNVTTFTGWQVGKIRQVDTRSLKQLMETNLVSKLDDATKEVIVAFIEGHGVNDNSLITVERICSASETANKNELARASIDVHSLLGLAASAIVTGDLTGTPISAKEKIDLIKLLVNKALPDPKSVEQLEVAQRVDRAKRKAEDMTESDLRKLTRDELLDLIK